MIAVAAAQIKAIDRMTIEDYHIPGTILMEHAAIKVAEKVLELDASLPITVVCGVGNNGGDGLAVARLCYLAGREVDVVLVGDLDRHTEDAKVMYRGILGFDIGIKHITTQDDCEALEERQSIVVDGLFGIGCTRALESYYKRTVEWMNRCGDYIVSIDMPSGIHTDTGHIMGVAVMADATISFTLPKLGNIMGEGRRHNGQLTIVGIGIPEEVIRRFDHRYELIDEEILRYFPTRRADGHKMTFGRLLMIAGSESMSGAGILAVKGAYRTGAGLVEVVTHKNGLLAMQQAVPEAIIHCYNSNEEGYRLLTEISQRMDQYNGVLIGPGLSKSDFAKDMLQTVLTHCHCPLVIDADGLNLLPTVISEVDEYDHPIILTPHLGEMSRLTGREADEIKQAPFDYAGAYSQAHGVITVLKSDRTIVANPEGTYCINMMGNSGMATAGSGDVLAGIMVALIGQGVEATKAAALGVGIHSMAGDIAAETLGESSVMASDMIDAVQRLLKIIGD